MDYTLEYRRPSVRTLMKAVEAVMKLPHKDRRTDTDESRISSFMAILRGSTNLVLGGETKNIVRKVLLASMEVDEMLYAEVIIFCFRQLMNTGMRFCQALEFIVGTLRKNGESKGWDMHICRCASCKGRYVFATSEGFGKVVRAHECGVEVYREIAKALTSEQPISDRTIEVALSADEFKHLGAFFNSGEIPEDVLGILHRVVPMERGKSDQLPSWRAPGSRYAN